MKYTKDAQSIIDAVGGIDNVAGLYHCVTRLRFNLHDSALANEAAVRAVPSVVGVNDTGAQYQVIVGNDVPQVFAAIVEDHPALKGGSTDAAPASNQKRGIRQGFQLFFDFIAGVFAPILPAIAGAGLLKGILSLSSTLGWVDATSQTFTLLSALADAPFFFLPVLVAFSAARKLNANIFVAATLGAALVYPGLTALMSAGDAVAFLGMPVTAVSYSYSVIPALLGVYLMSWVERGANRVIPSSLKLMFVPLVTLLITFPITLIALGPIGTFVGNGVAGGINWLLDNGGAFSGALIGALIPLIIMTGMHYALVPFILSNLATLGFDKFLPLTYVQALATSGATFGVFLRAKSKSIKQLALSTSFTALMGVTEPALYGINVPLRRPFIATMLGASAGGAISLGFGVKAYVLAGNGGLPGLPALVGETFGWALVGLVVAFVVGAILAYVLGFDESILAKAGATTETTVTPPTVAAGSADDALASPIAGTAILLSDVPDTTFSERLVGDGAAVIPSDGHLVSPVNGRVSTVFGTRHAITLVSDTGAEILIHIGLDTVNLKGQYFTALVADGDTVEIGTPLIDFDLEAVAAIHNPVTIMVVANVSDFASVTADNLGPVTPGDTIVRLEAKSLQEAGK